MDELNASMNGRATLKNQCDMDDVNKEKFVHTNNVQQQIKSGGSTFIHKH